MWSPLDFIDLEGRNPAGQAERRSADFAQIAVRLFTGGERFINFRVPLGIPRIKAPLRRVSGPFWVRASA